MMARGQAARRATWIALAPLHRRAQRSSVRSVNRLIAKIRSWFKTDKK